MLLPMKQFYVKPTIVPIKSESNISLLMASQRDAVVFNGNTYYIDNYIAEDGILELRSGLYKDLYSELMSIKSTFGSRSEEYFAAMEDYIEIQQELNQKFEGQITKGVSMNIFEQTQDNWEDNSPFGN